jgi:hypothetical protein
MVARMGTLRFLADENFDGRIATGLLRQAPALDLVRVQDVGLSGADDPTVLEWAAAEGRLLLTHDRRTIPDHAKDRVSAGLAMPGVVIVPQTGTLQSIIEWIILLDGASLPGEWEGQVLTPP